MRKRLLAIRHQKLVKVRVSASDLDVLDVPNKNQLVGARSKSDLAAKVCCEFGTGRAAATMHDSRPARRQAQARQVPAQADQQRHKKLDLMSI
jgi:hypothetical protein